MPASLLAIGLGAACGALLRWALALALNPLWPELPPGTLAVNLAGGYAIGLALAVFVRRPQWHPRWRLFVVTGLLGGMTTFSSFSAEVALALRQGRAGWAAALLVAHVAGSAGLTLAGLATPAALRRLKAGS